MLRVCSLWECTPRIDYVSRVAVSQSSNGVILISVILRLSSEMGNYAYGRCLLPYPFKPVYIIDDSFLPPFVFSDQKNQLPFMTGMCLVCFFLTIFSSIQVSQIRF